MTVRPQPTHPSVHPSGDPHPASSGPADGTNPGYVAWLEQQSMLQEASVLARQVAGQSSMWLRPYALPDPRAAVRRASVWFTSYPLSMMTARGQSFISALGSPQLWEAFSQIGIDAVHTGPLKLSGGIRGWEFTGSVDGNFDRISLRLDPAFGTEDEFRGLCATAAQHGGTVIDDIIPGHTGKGADFRLAELGHGDYPGIYHMVEIPPEAWHLLPDVPDGADAANLSPHAERLLAEAGYIIGELQRVIFYEPGVKETNWSATAPVRDTEGRLRRWVYLHYFKDGQPTINWLDPTFAGARLVTGDALHALLDLGAGGLRLDANGFLGIERSTTPGPAWSEGHPLSLAANQLIGSLVRKVGGFTFQELNLGMDDIRRTGELGPDLSYDFATRPAYQVALCTGDTGFLRLTLREAMKTGIDTASLVHALQNHDELTYELVHFAGPHREDRYHLGGVEYTGEQLAQTVRGYLRERLTGPAAPYNALFVQNGIASTTASVITASLGIADLTALTAAEIRQVRDAHLLLCRYNAWQPGVFALSGWDLVGALPLERHLVTDLIATGDTRWLNRGAYDLMGWAPEAEVSTSGIPVATALYGPLPEQLQDPDSFASQVAGIVRLRKESGIATAALLDAPEIGAPSLLAMVCRLESGRLLTTVLNFAPHAAAGRVESAYLGTGPVTDLATGAVIAQADGGFDVQLPAFGGAALVVG